MILKLTVDGFEGENAILVTEDGGKIIWPADKLPKTGKGGKLLAVMANEESGAESDHKKLARSILEEILSSGEE